MVMVRGRVGAMDMYGCGYGCIRAFGGGFMVITAMLMTLMTLMTPMVMVPGHGGECAPTRHVTLNALCPSQPASYINGDSDSQVTRAWMCQGLAST